MTKKATFLILVVIFPFLLNAQEIKVMLVTGGHAYDTAQFFQMFEKFENIRYQHVLQPKANALIAQNKTKDFDVLVFYDMWKKISMEEKQAYHRLTRNGKPLLFMHHSIASYQDWPEFEKIIGGKYVSPGDGIPESEESNYEHDVWVYGEVLKNHPVTEGLTLYKVFDEVYGNVRISESVIPLLKTNHPKSSDYIAWENRYNNSKIIYLQGGHDYRAYESEVFMKLVYQAIQYLATSNQP